MNDERDELPAPLGYYSPATSPFDRPVAPFVRRARLIRKAVLVATVGIVVLGVVCGAIWYWHRLN